MVNEISTWLKLWTILHSTHKKSAAKRLPALCGRAIEAITHVHWNTSHFFRKKTHTWTSTNWKGEWNRKHNCDYQQLRKHMEKWYPISPSLLNSGILSFWRSLWESGAYKTNTAMTTCDVTDDPPHAWASSGSHSWLWQVRAISSQKGVHCLADTPKDYPLVNMVNKYDT